LKLLLIEVQEIHCVQFIFLFGQCFLAWLRTSFDFGLETFFQCIRLIFSFSVARSSRLVARKLSPVSVVWKGSVFSAHLFLGNSLKNQATTMRRHGANRALVNGTLYS